ncbi:MAG: FtsB family cell division protein [Caldisericaceae bacterium]
MAKRKFSPFTFLMVVLVIYLAGEVLLTGFYYFKARFALEAAEQEVNSLTLQNKQMEDQIKGLNSDFAIEKIAREDLCLAKPGETIVYFKDTESAAPSESKSSTNFFQKVFENLLKLFKK